MSQDPHFNNDTLPPMNPEYPIPSPPLPGDVPQTPPPVPNSPAVGAVPNYLVWAILETICCCLPLGVAGLVYALKANSAAQLGNYEQGMQAAKTAKICLIIGVVLGVLVNLVNIAVQMADFASRMD